MTYQDLMDSALRIARESSIGYVEQDVLLDFIDKAQVRHLNYLEGRLSDFRPHDPVAGVNDSDVTDIEARLEPFLETTPVLLTNGRGTLPPLWTKPRTVATSGYRKKCGTEATASDRRYAATWKAPNEFNACTSSAYPPTIDTAIWRHTGKRGIQVSPPTISAVEVSYYEKPPYPVPADTVPWKDKDAVAVLGYVIRDIGARYEVPSLMEYGLIVTNREV